MPEATASAGTTSRPELDPPALSTISPATRAAVQAVTEQFWLDAASVDAASVVPAAHLEALASAGFYGVHAPVDEGGLGLDYAEACVVVEELASGCVASTFVWAQHLGLLRAVLDPTTPATIRGRFRADVITGRCKAGVVLTGLMPGPVRLAAEPRGDGWVLRGEAPWVSGWGTVDQLLVVARGPGSTAVAGVVEARERPGLTAERERLSALNATATVRLGFDAVPLPAEDVVRTSHYDQARQASQGLRLNGSFALGVAKRCCLLIGPSPLDGELAARRSQLDAAGPDGAGAPAARAAACELAVRAAHALAVSRGSRSALAGDVAERLQREASLLLVFGSRPAIKSELLGRFGATP